jgi:lysophospholipase L1-like esterase
MKTLLISILASCILSATAQDFKQHYALSDTTRFSKTSGHGYDITPTPLKGNKNPFFYSINVPDGNYLVTLKLGSKKQSGITTVRAESRRLFVQQQATKKGQFVEVSFVVNKRTPFISENESVKIKDREKLTLTWDDKLTLEFNGEAPVCESIQIQAAPEDVTTVFLCGNSTVVDQGHEPWASWGQMIPSFFDNKICIANYAESGESANSFISAGRLKKALSQMKKGDYLFVEFGHNDQKQTGPGKGAYYSFMYNLKIFIDEARAKGGIPVLVTPTQRRKFDENGKNLNTHGEFPDAIRWIADKEKVAVIDLNSLTNKLYEAMGEEASKHAFVHYPAGSFPGQNTALADNTHFNTYGAYEVAKCVISGLMNKVPELSSHIQKGFLFDPQKPDNFENFKWELSPFFEAEKPDGN